MNLPSNGQHVDDENGFLPFSSEPGGQAMPIDGVPIDWDTILAKINENEGSSLDTNFLANPFDLHEDNAENSLQSNGDIGAAAISGIKPNSPLPIAQSSEASNQLSQPYCYRCPLCDMAFRHLEHQVRHTRNVHLSKRPQVPEQPSLQTAESFVFPSEDTSSTAPGQLGIGSSSTSQFSDGTMLPASQLDLFNGLEHFDAEGYSNYFTSADLGQYPHYSPLGSPRGSPTSGSGVLSERQVSPVSYGSGISGESYPPRSGKKGKKSVNMSYSKIVKKASTPYRQERERPVGRRRRPITPEQRRQAHEIRKLRACLRCKFLRRTCDKNTPCEPCQHLGNGSVLAVPCTRLQVRDLGYFLKDWKVDYEEQAGSSLSVFNIQGFSSKETMMWVTHGHGVAFPVMVREIFLRSDDRSSRNQTLSSDHNQDSMPSENRPNNLAIGSDGVSDRVLDEYLDKHINTSFQTFIDRAFTGAPFVTEVLQTIHEFQSANGSLIVRKSLKLVLAYCLTTSITSIDENGFAGQAAQDSAEADPLGSRHSAAGTMVDGHIRCCLADIWRGLHKEILEELSQLHEALYMGGERFKNWLTMFMLSLVLLITWERMQYDCHCRASDPAVAASFCQEMEAVPFRVIKGLCRNTTRRIPDIDEWPHERGLHLPETDVYGRSAMKQMRRHILKYEAYLSTREDAKFDRDDPHSLSNKFLSQVVLRDSWGSHAKAGAPA